MRKLVLAAGLGSILGVGALGVTQLPNLATAQNSGSDTQASGDASGLIEYEQNTINVVKEHGPSVVSVNVLARGQSVQNPREEFPEGFEEFLDQLPPQFREFFDQQQEQQGQERQQQTPPQEGAGSGFVIDDAGRMITNYHVVAAALQEDSVNLTEGSEITVTFPSNDEELPVRVVGANALYDLALLELQNPDALPQDATPIPVANSDDLQVGQKTIAIGNPFGFEFSVTTGVVSGVGRSLIGVGEADIPLVQTDAAINPGNSGGPLLNSSGELIGINTAIIPSLSITGQRGNQGVGFAVPSSLLQENLAQLEEGGFVSLQTRARLGIGILPVEEAYPEEIRQDANLPDEGIVVTAVQEGSAAESAGLRAPLLNPNTNQPVPESGDVITAVNGEPVTTTGELQNAILSRGEGDTVTLTTVRDGQEQQVDVTLAQVPQQNQQNQQQNQDN